MTPLIMNVAAQIGRGAALGDEGFNHRDELIRGTRASDAHRQGLTGVLVARSASCLDGRVGRHIVTRGE